MVSTAQPASENGRSLIPRARACPSDPAIGGSRAPVHRRCSYGVDRKGSLRRHRWLPAGSVEVHPEALRLGLEPHRTVEGVCPVLGVALVRQQLHLVAPSVPCIDE